MKSFLLHLVAAIALIACVHAKIQLAPGECEVCLEVMKKFANEVKVGTDETVAIEGIKNVCKTFTDRKEKQMCYFIGAREDSASTMLKDVARPLSIGMPTKTACLKLRKKDEALCSMRYEKEMDLDQDLSKLRIRDLKRILAKWGEECKGCSEKSEYLDMIKRLRPKHDKKFKSEL